MRKEFLVSRLVSLFLLIGLPLTGLAQTGTIAAFALEQNDLTVVRLAQPLQYFDKIGERAGLMGYEGGTFEAWIWPWKPLRNFELSFLLGTSTLPILAKDIVRTIASSPEATVITYAYESFTVREIITIPRNQPGAILLLDVRTTTPLTIVGGFLPVMQPMWPAGIGGQYSYWDDNAHGFVISEGQRRAVFLCGSPAGQQMAAPPAHMFADNPLQFKIDVQPAETEGKFIPIIIAGEGGASLDSVKSLYTRLWRDAERYYRENVTYYHALRNSTTRIITPDRNLNRAFEWGKVALDNLLVTNPRLGRGLVAGYGLSGGGERPGFAWFFGGDAFINALALDSYGAYRTVREALAFTQKWQRQENFPIRKKKPDEANADVGKMAHELSQSDGLCDWWNDYHYGYNHADTTPWYIVAMGDYVRSSGDVEFLRLSWPSLKQAYAWCLRKDSDGDGLMDLKGAGLGALEFGKLVGIYADVYTCGVWVQAIKEMGAMAAVLGDTDFRREAEALLNKAEPVLEKKFWIEELGCYSYGATEKGEQVREKTPWPGVAMMFGLLDRERTSRNLRILNSADLTTDWGMRSLSSASPLFEPTNYNYGAVWPFISSFMNTAQFKYHYTLAGLEILNAVSKHSFDNGIGLVPEVFSGTLNQKLGEGYHHQGFSTTGYILPMMKGLIGLSTNALAGSVTWEPQFPADWGEVAIEHCRVGENFVGLKYRRESGRVSIDLATETPDTMTIHLAPVLGGGTSILAVSLNGAPVPFKISATRHSVQPLVDFTLRGKATVEFTLDPGIEFLPPRTDVNPGDKNHGLKIVSTEWAKGRITLEVEGISGTEYRLGLVNGGIVQSVTGARLEGDALVIKFDSGKAGAFVQREIVIATR